MRVRCMTSFYAFTSVSVWTGENATLTMIVFVWTEIKICVYNRLRVDGASSENRSIGLHCCYTVLFTVTNLI